MAKKYHGRAFLCPSPSTNSVSWETYIKDFPDTVGQAFYGKLTICWSGKLIGFHSYSEDGVRGFENFLDKLRQIDTALCHYRSLIETGFHGRSLVDLNENTNNHFSGTVFINRSKVPSTGELLSILEFASCKEKIRIHSGDDEKAMLKTLDILRRELSRLTGACSQVQYQYKKLKGVL
jgi:hypothetical protein